RARHPGRISSRKVKDLAGVRIAPKRKGGSRVVARVPIRGEPMRFLVTAAQATLVGVMTAGVFLVPIGTSLIRAPLERLERSQPAPVHAAVSVDPAVLAMAKPKPEPEPEPAKEDAVAAPERSGPERRQRDGDAKHTSGAAEVAGERGR